MAKATKAVRKPRPVKLPKVKFEAPKLPARTSDLLAVVNWTK
jgi:hypothetical protein